jgi:hypothetical protein
MTTLFDLPPLSRSEIALALIGLKCRHCEHAEAWQCNSKVFHYCRARKSNRTDNGLLKIKLKDQACLSFLKKTDLSTPNSAL